jgi:hypothetical protein
MAPAFCGIDHRPLGFKGTTLEIMSYGLCFVLYLLP